jgi:hypothetical protein
MRVTIESGTVTPVRQRAPKVNPFLQSLTQLANDLSGEPKRAKFEDIELTGEDVVLSKRADGTEILVDAAERTARRQIADAAKELNLSADIVADEQGDSLTLYVGLVARRRGGRPANAVTARVTDPAAGLSNAPVTAERDADGFPVNAA